MRQSDHFPLPPEYRLVGELGTGGMGRVFECVCNFSQQRVAIKVSRPDLDRVGQRLCLREAWISSRLSVANVVRVHAYGQLHDQIWMTMDLVRGVSLRQKLNEGVLSLDQRLDILSTVASTLADLHALGVVHRDVKPENILVAEDGTPHLIDFGLAKLESEEEIDATVMGTLYCMPLERLLGQKSDRRSDIFQLGVLAYELFGTARPWSECTSPTSTVLSLLHQPPADFLSVLSFQSRRAYDVMLAISGLINRMVTPEPESRPWDARELVQCLNDARSASIEMLPPVWVDPVEVDPSRPSLEALCGAAV